MADYDYQRINHTISFKASLYIPSTTDIAGHVINSLVMMPTALLLTALLYRVILARDSRYESWLG